MRGLWSLSRYEPSSLRSEAELSSAGVEIERERIIAALGNRLRMVETVKRNPEILKERVRVAAVVVSLPRTGSTMLQRLLGDSAVHGHALVGGIQLRANAWREARAGV